MRIILLLSTIAVIGCSGKPTTAPSPPAPTLVSVSGTVTAFEGGTISGATVTVQDGPQATQRTQTDATGRYRFDNLAAGTITFRTTATGYQPLTGSVSASTSVVFDRLLQLLEPRLVVDRVDLSVVVTPTGYRVSGTFTNTGEGCASGVRGELRVSEVGQVIETLPIAVDAALVVKPQQQSAYSACCLTPTATGKEFTYTAALTAQTVKCPS